MYNNAFLTVLESLMIVTALSMDAFVASFAYGANKIKIPFSCVTVINLVCSSILGISIFFGSVISNFIPEIVTRVICFAILFVLGFLKISESLVSWYINKNRCFKKYMNFSFLGLNFGTLISPCEEKDEKISGKIMGIKESAYLSVALSLDGLAVGFGAALANSNGIQIVAFSLVSDMLAVMLGCFLGNKIAKKVSFNLSWLSGAILIVLAILKLS